MTLRGKETPKIFQNFFCIKYLIETLKVMKYQHHMTVFKKLTVEIVRAWRNPPPPPPPPGTNRVKRSFLKTFLDAVFIVHLDFLLHGNTYIKKSKSK